MTPRHYDMTTLYDALRAKLITWEGVQASQENRYPRCANGCGLPGKYRTLDDRELCETCYTVIAADECKKVYE